MGIYSFVIYTVDFPDVREDVWCIAVEMALASESIFLVDRAMVVELEHIFDLVVVLGQDVFISIPDCLGSFVDPDHHVNHEVPVFVENEYHR